jgi:hypothetical protein
LRLPARLARRLVSALPFAWVLASCTFPEFVVEPPSSTGGGAATSGVGGAMGNEAGTAALLAGQGGASEGGDCSAGRACDEAGAPAAGAAGESPIVVDQIPGLVLAYSFDDASTTIADASGNEHTAHVGDFAWVSGHQGNALELDGKFGYLNLPTSGITDGLGDFSITLWVKPRSLTNWVRLFDFGTGTDAFMMLSAVNSGTGKPRLALRAPGIASQNLESSIALTLDTWQLVSVTQAGDTATLYIDGVVAASSTAVTFRASSFSASKNYLGKSQYADPTFDGAFDEFRLYNRALTPAEIESIRSGTAINKGLLLGYDFDESSGQIAADLLQDGAKQAGVRTGVTFGPGKSGAALELDGAAGYVRLPEDALDGVSDFTIACFVNQLALKNSARLFDFGNDSTNYITLMPNANSTQLLRFASRFDPGIEQFLDTVPLAVGSWNHVATTRSGSQVRLYVDGEQVGSRVIQGLPAQLGTTGNWLGRSHRGDPMLQSALDDFRIYDRALSSAEIAALAAGP